MAKAHEIRKALDTTSKGPTLFGASTVAATGAAGQHFWRLFDVDVQLTPAMDTQSRHPLAGIQFRDETA